MGKPTCKFCGRLGRCIEGNYANRGGCMFKLTSAFGIRYYSISHLKSRCDKCTRPACVYYMLPAPVGVVVKQACLDHIPLDLLSFRGCIRLAALRREGCQ